MAQSNTTSTEAAGSIRFVEALLFGWLMFAGYMLIAYAAEKVFDWFPKIPIEYGFVCTVAGGIGYALGFANGWRRPNRVGRD